MASIDEKFAAAYVDNGATHSVLGVKLRPFCLWHLLLLKIIYSPFINAGDVEWFDLQTAVGICRLSYRQSKIKRPHTPIWKRDGALKKETIKFLTYVGDYFNKPDYGIIPLSEGTSNRKMGTPPPEIVSAAYDAAEAYGCSVGEAWNMPIGEAYISQAYAFKRRGGNLDFVDPEERQYTQEMEEAGFLRK